MEVYTFKATSNMGSFSTDVKEFFNYLEDEEDFPSDSQNLIGMSNQLCVVVGC
jgi:xyloglucan-specific endo-beta-1,4-glucanase